MGTDMKALGSELDALKTATGMGNKAYDYCKKQDGG